MSPAQLPQYYVLSIDDLTKKRDALDEMIDYLLNMHGVVTFEYVVFELFI